MTENEFVGKWLLRFRNNDLFEIDEGDLREFAQDIAATFGQDDPRAVFEHIFENQFGKHPEFNIQHEVNAFVLQMLTAKQVLAAPDAPEFSLFDDAANTVVLSHKNYSYVDLRYDLPGGAVGLPVPADGIIRPGNIAGQIVGYVRAAGGRLQSNKVYSQPFTSVTVAPPVRPTAPRLVNFDDVANTVGVYHPNYSYVDLRYNFNGQTGLLVSADGLISVGNVAGQVEVYVVADPAQNRMQSLPAYSQPFTTGTVVVTPPTPTPLAVAFTIGSTSLTAGQGLSFSAQASGGVAPYAHEVSATNTDTGVVTGIGAFIGAQYAGNWASVPAGIYQLTDTLTDAAGTVKISAVRTVTVTASTPGNTTPTAPAWSFDPALRLLSLAHATLAGSELEVSYKGGAYEAYVASLAVDALAHQPGDWKGRVKAMVGRNVSADADSPLIVAKPTGTKTGKFLLVIDGDSRMFSPTAENPVFDQLFAKLPSNWTVVCRAVGGSTSLDARNRVTQTVDTLYDPITYDEHFYFYMGGLNDFHLNPNNRDATATKANLAAIYQGRAAKGFRVLAGTSTTTRGLDYNPLLEDVNQYIRTNAASWGIAQVVDLAVEPALQNPFDINVWKDAVHLQPFANTIMARAIKRKLDDVLASLNYITSPSMFSVDTVYEGGLSTLSKENVVWINHTPGVTSSGNTVNLIPGGSAHSSRAAGSSTAAVRAVLEFRVPAITYSSIWLSDTASVANNYDDALFALFFKNDGTIAPRGLDPIGPNQASYGYAPGDVFTIQVERSEQYSSLGQYSWYQNGTKRGTWLQVVPTGNLQVDTASDTNGSFADVKLGGPNLVTLGATTPKPTLTASNPASGPVGTNIVLSGSNLNGATYVRFNTTDAPGYGVQSSGTIQVPVPAGLAAGNYLITVGTVGGASNALPFTVTAVAAPQDVFASTYSLETGEAVVWTDMFYASASGSTLHAQYVISRANATRRIGASSNTLRGYLEFTNVNSQNTSLSFITPDMKKSGDDAQPGITGLGIQTADYAGTQRILGDNNATFATVPGDVIRLQIGTGGTSLFINGEFKRSFACTIPTDDLIMALVGNGGQTFGDCKIWGANLV